MVPLMTPVAGNSTGTTITYFDIGEKGWDAHAETGSDLIALESLFEELFFLIAFDLITTSCD